MESINSNNEGYRKAFEEDDESLAIFLRNMAKFDRLFCDLMAGGTDFTLSLEVRGNVGKMSICKVRADSYDRPGGKDEKISGRGIAKQTV